MHPRLLAKTCSFAKGARQALQIWHFNFLKDYNLKFQMALSFTPIANILVKYCAILSCKAPQSCISGPSNPDARVGRAVSSVVASSMR